MKQARLELREAEQARDAARQQLGGEKSASHERWPRQSLLQEPAISVATPEIDARIEAQKRNLDALLQRFTEQHPDIVSARRLIKDLEEQKRKEVAGAAARGHGRRRGGSASGGATGSSLATRS